MQTSTPGRTKPGTKTRRTERATPTPTYLDRRTKNQIAREFLTWSLQLDFALGRKVTVENEPYRHYGREAVSRLIAKFSPSQPTPAVPARSTRRSRRASTPARDTLTSHEPVDFEPDEISDLFR
jgi:hypothetical protein